MKMRRSCLKRPDGGSAQEERRLSFASGSAQSAQQPPTPPALYSMHAAGRSAHSAPAIQMTGLTLVYPAECFMPWEYPKELQTI